MKGIAARAFNKGVKEAQSQGHDLCSQECCGNTAGEPEPQSLKALEKAFWKCFGDKVSEWNPCFSEEGQERFRFDGDVGAHDVEVDGEKDFVRTQPEVDLEKDLVKTQPTRVNLRSLLDVLFADEAQSRPLDLRPLRRLVASLVQSCGRHDRHSTLAPKRTDACARGKPGCYYCRYGFPKELHGRVTSSGRCA